MHTGRTCYVNISKRTVQPRAHDKESVNTVERLQEFRQLRVAVVNAIPANFRQYERTQGPKKGLTDARSAVSFCLGSGLFGSYNSD